MLRIRNQKKGGLSVILASTVVYLGISMIFLNIFVSILDYNTYSNVQSIVRTETDTIANREVINGNIYSFYNKDISKFIPVLKDYSTVYTVYSINNQNEISQELEISGSKDINIMLQPNQIVEVKVKQNTTSMLQKMNNFLKGSNISTGMVISEKRVVR